MWKWMGQLGGQGLRGSSLQPVIAITDWQPTLPWDWGQCRQTQHHPWALGTGGLGMGSDLATEA